MRGVHNLVTKIHNLEALRRYGFAEDEIIELQSLKKESEDKVEEFKVSDNYRTDNIHRNNIETLKRVSARPCSIGNCVEMRTVEREGEPYWFKVTIMGYEYKVDQCILFRLVTGTIIMIMTVFVFLISFGLVGNSAK